MSDKKLNYIIELIKNRNHDTPWNDFETFFSVKTEPPFQVHDLDYDSLEQLCKDMWDVGRKVGLKNNPID